MNNALPIKLLIDKSPSVFHVVKNIEDKLLNEGFIELKENEAFDIELGKSYYVKRNNSSIIAFRLPKQPKPGFRIVATHNDSPTFVIKPNPILNKAGVSLLNVEPYGGGIYYSWFDRPLSFAGRVFVKEKDVIQEVLVDLEEDGLVIPSLAIHMDREVNEGRKFNPAKDVIPLWLVHEAETDFHAYLKEKFNLPGEVVSFDLSLYVHQEGKFVGGDQDLLLSPKLDDLACTYSSLLAFMDSKENKEGFVEVFASFDNEEVGSLTQQGANSDFLKNTLRRVSVKLGYDEDARQIAQANTVLLSADNAHANHPNFPELSDATTKVKLNGGVVLKYNAAQHYTTNGKSSAYVKNLALAIGEPIQEFTNRSDLRGGSTLGNLSNAEISVLSADIGIAQLAMHSAVELCGEDDINGMVLLLKAHYQGV